MKNNYGHLEDKHDVRQFNPVTIFYNGYKKEANNKRLLSGACLVE